jgi:hypothetical protein
MSKTLSVWSLVSYLTEVDGITWRSEDYTANKIIKLLKGRPLNGYFNVKINGQTKTINQLNVKHFMPVLFQAVANKLNSIIRGEYCIVPIPNSEAAVDVPGDFLTLQHARAIAEATGGRASAIPALRWKAPKEPAHRGGTRDPQIHHENLVLIERPKKQIVIFDDVMTTGGQMIGAYRRLQDAGQPIHSGMVIGRATKEQKVEALGWDQEDLPVEEVEIDWASFLGDN